MKRSLVILFTICFFSSLSVSAGEFSDKFDIKLRVGYNFGGTSPLGLPAEIRAIKSYTPSFAPSIALHISHMFNDKWGLNIGLRTEYKGMTTRADVKYYYTTINIGDNNQPISGYYSGEIKTKVQNGYLSLPVTAIYKLGDKWEVQAGMYGALLLASGFTGTAKNGYLYSDGQKLPVEGEAPYDFSNQVRKFDFGLEFAGERKITEHFSASAQLTWGLAPIFPSSFESVTYKMYNIYLNIGGSYKF